MRDRRPLRPVEDTELDDDIRACRRCAASLVYIERFPRRVFAGSDYMGEMTGPVSAMPPQGPEITAGSGHAVVEGLLDIYWEWRRRMSRPEPAQQEAGQ